MSIKYSSWGPIFRTYVLFRYDHTRWTSKRRRAPLQEGDQIFIVQMTETPLTPNDIESRVGIVVAGNIPKPLQFLRISLRSCRIEILKGPLEERHALGSIADTRPSINVAFVAGRRPLTASMRLLYK